jgi:hypothetical protein
MPDPIDYESQGYGQDEADRMRQIDAGVNPNAGTPPPAVMPYWQWADQPDRPLADPKMEAARQTALAGGDDYANAVKQANQIGQARLGEQDLFSQEFTQQQKDALSRLNNNEQSLQQALNEGQIRPTDYSRQMADISRQRKTIQPLPVPKAPKNPPLAQHFQDGNLHVDQNMGLAFFRQPDGKIEVRPLNPPEQDVQQLTAQRTQQQQQLDTINSVARQASDDHFKEADNRRRDSAHQAQLADSQAKLFLTRMDAHRKMAIDSGEGNLEPAELERRARGDFDAMDRFKQGLHPGASPPGAPPGYMPQSPGGPPAVAGSPGGAAFNIPPQGMASRQSLDDQIRQYPTTAPRYDGIDENSPDEIQQAGRRAMIAHMMAVQGVPLLPDQQKSALEDLDRIEAYRKSKK